MVNVAGVAVVVVPLPLAAAGCSRLLTSMALVSVRRDRRIVCVNFFVLLGILMRMWTVDAGL